MIPDVKLILATHVYICHKNMKAMGFFYSFLQVFAENIYKIYFTGNESNGLRLRQ